MRDYRLCEHEEIISLYALGALDGDDLVGMKNHLMTGCKSCEEMLKETELILTLIPFALGGPQLSPRVRKKLWSQILYS